MQPQKNQTRQLTLQRTSTGVDIFFSLILSYFCFLVAAYKNHNIGFSKYLVNNVNKDSPLNSDIFPHQRDTLLFIES